ncbi:hypothetical protein L208DRAFT_1559400, partial [Tricholoma matsutake]
LPRHPQQLTVTTAPMYQQILLNKVYNSMNVVWSLEPATLKLTKWHWPIHARKHVALGALREHCEHYQFLGPSCLCLLLQQVSKDLVFTEGAIYIPVFGTPGSTLPNVKTADVVMILNPGKPPKLPMIFAQVRGRVRDIPNVCGPTNWKTTS